jgi:predicted N-acetyltransferase YhbS
MITVRSENVGDVAAREALLDRAYGPARFEKPSQRLRAGRAPALAFVALDKGEVVGTVRLWPVLAGAGRPALLLGPLAVHPGRRCRGIGAALMWRALRAAREAGHAAVLLAGDARTTAASASRPTRPGRSRCRAPTSRRAFSASSSRSARSTARTAPFAPRCVVVRRPARPPALPSHRRHKPAAQ